MPVTLPPDSASLANKMQFALNPLAWTWVDEVADNINANYPGSNAYVFHRPRLVMRTTNTSSSYLLIDFGSAKTIPVISIEGHNFASLQINGGNTTSASTSIRTITSSLTAVDYEDGRRKCWIVLSGFTSMRYMKLTPSSVDAGASYFELGIVAAYDSSNVWTFTRGPTVPYQKGFAVSGQGNEYPLGGFVRGSYGIPYAEISLNGRFELADSASLTDWSTLARYSQSKGLSFFENKGDLTKVYHCFRQPGYRIQRGNDRIYQVENVDLREVA